MTISSSDPISMDHVALASTHAWDQVVRYVDHLGGQWLGGPELEEESPFYFCQVALEGGTKIELLEPIAGAGSDFLRRFLQRNGPGPHHFTFKVPHFDDAIATVSSAGYDVVGIDRSDDDWTEGFLHPKQSHGIVIQIVEDRGTHDGWDLTSLPPSTAARPPTMESVDHLVADLDAATKLFTGPLALTETERGSSPDGDYAVLHNGPWRLVLIEPKRDDWRHWLGPRPGRLLRLSLAVDDPGGVPGAVKIDGDDGYELPPERNLGTRLHLRGRSDGA